MEKVRFFLLVPVLLVQCFIASLGISTPANLTTDEAALVALKSNITIDPSNVLASNWSTTASCCNWIGVACGGRHQRVTALNISGMGLTGTIPPHLGNLSFLVSLDISNNGFHGNLPEELAFLRRLKVLNLGHNNLSGKLPSWFGFLTNLESLLLSNNSFSGVIPPEMGNLASLKILRIGNNGLTGLISSAIFNISSVEIMDFSYNNLSGSLPENMNNRLKLLSLSNNQLSGLIANALWKQRDLVTLSLTHNQFEGSIPREIRNLNAIKELFLSNNKFTEYGSGGIVSTKNDVYAYGIVLMETFTSKKHSDEMFTEDMSLKRWVSESLSHGVMDGKVSNLLTKEDEHFSAKQDCISSIMELALHCSAELPEQRVDMKDVLTTLNKIRTKFQMSVVETQKGVVVGLKKEEL